jgi:hypothetical protein
VSQPYPGPQYPVPEYPVGGPHAQAYPGPPPAYPYAEPRAYPYVPPPRRAPQYKSLRNTARAGIVLMGLTVLGAIVQSVLMWRSYDEVKQFIYGTLAEDEFANGMGWIGGSGPILNLFGLLVVGAGVLFLVWLWQARDNTEAFRGGRHRHEQGWVIGSWICPIVQFWYPLQVVQDVVRASEPADRPGAARSRETRALLYGWWAAWTGFWVIVVGGGGAALVSFIVWIVRLVDRVDAARATDDYVDIYDLQDFMVRVALLSNIGFSVATALLAVAGVASALLMRRVTAWQDLRMAGTGTPMPPARPQDSPAQYGPTQYGPAQPGPPKYGPGQPESPQYGPRSFPSYGPSGESSPWQR